MYHFTYWLEHYKEKPSEQVQPIVAAIVKLSEKTSRTCTSANIKPLVQCKTPPELVRTKQIITKSTELSQTEKRALSTFSDYLEFRAVSRFKFPDEPEPKLVKYCKTAPLTDSCKAVIISKLLRHGVTGVSIDDLVQEIIPFYVDRTDHGKQAEKDDSVFSKASISPTAVKKYIQAHTLKELTDAGIVVWDRRNGIVSINISYLPLTDVSSKEVQTLCKDYLTRYYTSIKPKKTKADKNTNHKKVQALVARLEEEIQKTSDKAAKKKLNTICTSLKKELEVMYKAGSTKPKTPAQASKATTIKKRNTKPRPKDYVDKKTAVSQVVTAGCKVFENISFATKQEFKNECWINPNVKLLAEDWTILLYNPACKQVQVFNIPADTFKTSHSTENGFKTRSDRPQKLEMKVNPTTHIEMCSGLDLSPYLCGVVEDGKFRQQTPPEINEEKTQQSLKKEDEAEEPNTSEIAMTAQ